MPGSSDPTPYDTTAIAALIIFGLIILAGVISGHHWPPHVSSFVRRAVALLAVVVVASPLFVTPTKNGIVGAGRLITLWPAVAVDGILFAIWVWRAGRV